ncbi:MAG: Spo0E like sporulation regulatory protein [Firmicutes bacterium]|nr:Spo0E like sporulation regulatory protein [Bacillota bacterium]
MEYLRSKIECLRQKMHITTFEKGISHPEVLKISQQLDEVINEFYNEARIQKVG